MSTKPSNLANPVVETTIDQAMIAKKKPSQKRIPPVRKQTRFNSRKKKSQRPGLSQLNFEQKEAYRVI